MDLKLTEYKNDIKDVKQVLQMKLTKILIVKRDTNNK